MTHNLYFFGIIASLKKNTMYQQHLCKQRYIFNPNVEVINPNVEVNNKGNLPYFKLPE